MDHARRETAGSIGAVPMGAQHPAPTTCVVCSALHQHASAARPPCRQGGLDSVVPMVHPIQQRNQSAAPTTLPLQGGLDNVVSMFLYLAREAFGIAAPEAQVRPRRPCRRCCIRGACATTTHSRLHASRHGCCLKAPGCLPWLLPLPHHAAGRGVGDARHRLPAPRASRLLCLPRRLHAVVRAGGAGARPRGAHRCAPWLRLLAWTLRTPGGPWRCLPVTCDSRCLPTHPRCRCLPVRTVPQWASCCTANT